MAVLEAKTAYRRAVSHGADLNCHKNILLLGLPAQQKDATILQFFAIRTIILDP
jgi:hypothetical protein